MKLTDEQRASLIIRMIRQMTLEEYVAFVDVADKKKLNEIFSIGTWSNRQDGALLMPKV